MQKKKFEIYLAVLGIKPRPRRSCRLRKKNHNVACYRYTTQPEKMGDDSVYDLNNGVTEEFEVCISCATSEFTSYTLFTSRVSFNLLIYCKQMSVCQTMEPVAPYHISPESVTSREIMRVSVERENNGIKEKFRVESGFDSYHAYPKPLRYRHVISQNLPKKLYHSHHPPINQLDRNIATSD